MKKKKLTIDILEIADAMDSSFDGAHNYYYLDLKTGEVILIQDEVMSIVEKWECKNVEGLAGWKKDMVKDAEKVAADEKNERYVAIPPLESWESFKQMEAFTQTVQDESLREKLAIALDGEGAFRRFKRILECHPRERDRWLEFKKNKMIEEAMRFLKEMNIEPRASNGEVSV